MGSRSRFFSAPTLDRSWGPEPSSDGVVRRARLRIDRVADDYPVCGETPQYAYVHLLQNPREGQPVVWASRGVNSLTVYRTEMARGGGIAFVVTGLVFPRYEIPVRSGTGHGSGT